jgi:hypothetical protein
MGSHLLKEVALLALNAQDFNRKSQNPMHRGFCTQNNSKVKAFKMN